MCGFATEGVKYFIAILLPAKINDSYCSGETINYSTNDSIIVKPKTSGVILKTGRKGIFFRSFADFF